MNVELADGFNYELLIHPLIPALKTCRFRCRNALVFSGQITFFGELAGKTAPEGFCLLREWSIFSNFAIDY